jgi:uncharacterized protein YPO0396
MQESVRQDHPRSLEALERQVEFQLAQLEAAGTVASFAERQLGWAHQEASELYQKTVAVAYRQIQALGDQGKLSVIQSAALYHFTEAYRYEMLMVSEATGEVLIREFETW